MWYAIRQHDLDGLRQRAHTARIVATHAKSRLDEIGWVAYRHPHAFTVVLRTPPEPVQRKRVLAGSDGWSHLIAMPGGTTGAIDQFLCDMVASITQHLCANSTLTLTSPHREKQLTTVD